MLLYILQFVTYLGTLTRATKVLGRAKNFASAFFFTNLLLFNASATILEGADTLMIAWLIVTTYVEFFLFSNSAQTTAIFALLLINVNIL